MFHDMDMISQFTARSLDRYRGNDPSPDCNDGKEHDINSICMFISVVM